MVTSSKQYLCILVIITLLFALFLQCRHVTRLADSVMYTDGPIYAGSLVDLSFKTGHVRVRRHREHGALICDYNQKRYYVNENPYTHVRTWQTKFSDATYH